MRHPEFPLSKELIYLNHAAVAPWPKRTSIAVSQFAQQNTLYGSSYYLDWLKKETELRTQLQALLNAPSVADIALVKNTSEALSFVAYGLNWQAGDNIVSSNEEFPSNRIVWQSLADTGAPCATSRNSGTPVAIIRSPTQRMGDALNALRPQRLRTKAASSLLPHWLDGYSECNSCSSRVLLAHVESANCPVAYQGLKITTSLSSVSMIFSEGVEFREADLSSTHSPEEALFALVDKQTRLITISSIQFASGIRLDIDKIGQFCKDKNLLFCIDAIQSLGAVQFDVQKCQADFVMADGHKWMFGPEGLGVFYTSPAAREKLKLTQYGWHMMKSTHNYENKPWDIHPTAQRFECGSPNMLGIHAFSTS